MSEASTPQTGLPFGPRDARVEAKFAEWNLKYRFEPALPIESIRVAEWAQVREADHLAPEDQVEEYRQQIAGGAVFPPVVLMAPDVLIDGNTRLRAHQKLRHKTIAAYVVDLASVQMAKSLAGTLNQMGGKRLTAEEAAEAAKTMMDMNFTDENIAREIGRSVEQVRYIRNQIEFGERARRLNLERHVPNINKDVRARLNTVKHDPPFSAFVDFVADVNPPRKVVSDVLKQVNEAKSDPDAIQIIETARQDNRPAGPPPRRLTLSPTIRQMSMHLPGLLSLSSDPVALLDPREDKRDERVRQWRELGNLSSKMLDLYGVGAEERQATPELAAV
jgi:hypothetical protein